uniref:Xyloglucan endotransglucosylase/hydrolase n=1 Tax=Saccharum spontaneum TaxID=62335 RepID=A0A678T8T8_SACSP|nr:Xyloglucan endotransglucosylase/hydrolase [Saccharum spontaneum]
MASIASSPPLPPLMLSLAVVLLLALWARGGEARPPPPLHGVRPLAFDEGYTQIFGSANLALLRDGRRVRLTLDESTGAGFASQDVFLHGFFSAAIKLPADYAAGVVVAFYLSNGDVYEKTHDELDFEFLGNVRGREWRVQTNVYGNGSTHAGREERYDLPFDPTDDFHHYSILWTSDRIIFYVDETPIREVVRTAAMGAAFPSKPMSLYATIWDGSAWATLGGRYRVNYKYAPFVAEFADLAIQGCAVDPTDHHSSSAAASCGAGLRPLAAVSAEQRAAMAAFRRAHTSYSYCHDRRRYPVALSECGAAGAGLLPGRMFGPDGMKQHRRHRAAPRGHRAAQDDVM